MPRPILEIEADLARAYSARSARLASGNPSLKSSGGESIQYEEIGSINQTIDLLNQELAEARRAAAIAEGRESGRKIFTRF